MATQDLKPVALVPEKGGKAPEKKEAKDSKGKQSKDQPSEEEKKALEEKAKKEIQDQIEIARKQAEDKKTRRHPNAYWAIRIKVELVITLFKMNRFQEAEQLIQVVKHDLKQLSDQHFTKIVVGYEARILIRQGKYNESVEKFLEAIKM